MPKNFHRHFVPFVFGELVRYWIIAALLHFITVAAQLDTLTTMLRAYIIGMPIVLIVGLCLVFIGALTVYIRHRLQWTETDNDTIRLNHAMMRLSLTDIDAREIIVHSMAADYQRENHA